MRRWVVAAVVGTSLVALVAALTLLGGSPGNGNARAQAAALATPKPITRPQQRAQVALAGPTSDPIPILMYHVVADPPAGAPFPELYVSGTAFAGQVAWLARHGYHAVSLQDAYDHWRLGRRLPARPIVFSFDDGYHSQLVTAAPILRRRHWAGVLNLEVRNTTHSWGLSPRQVRLLLASGWEIDAHTLTHPDLTQVDDARLTQEVAGSRSAIRKMLHVPAAFFCYPAGRLDDRVVAAVRAAGYLGATTTAPGLARPTDMFRLSRVRIDRSDGVAGLAAKLRALGSPS